MAADWIAMQLNLDKVREVQNIVDAIEAELIANSISSRKEVVTLSQPVCDVVSEFLRHDRMLEEQLSLQRTKIKRYVVGLLHAFWSIFDQNSADGVIEGLSVRALEAELGHVGFCKLLVDQGWLQIDANRLIMPNFDNFNGRSFKKRHNDATRQHSHRTKDSKEPKTKTKKCDIVTTEPATVSQKKCDLQDNTTHDNTNTEEEASTAPVKGKRSTKQPKTALEPIQEYSHGVSFLEAPSEEQRKHFGLSGFCIPVADGRSYFYRITHIQEMQKMRPDVDFQFELRKIRDYLEANPQKARTCRGMATTLNNWLSRIPVKPIEKPKAIPPEHRKFPQGGVINARPRS